MKTHQLRQIIREEIENIVKNADSIIGLVNNVEKDKKTLKVIFKNKEYEISKFLNLGYKTITFKLKSGEEKSFKHKDQLIIII